MGLLGCALEAWLWWAFEVWMGLLGEKMWGNEEARSGSFLFAPARPEYLAGFSRTEWNLGGSSGLT